MALRSVRSRWLPLAAGAFGLLALALVAWPAVGPLRQDHPTLETGAVVPGAAVVIGGAALVGHPRSRVADWAGLLGGVLWPATSWGVDRAGFGPTISWTSVSLP